MHFPLSWMSRATLPDLVFNWIDDFSVGCFTSPMIIDAIEKIMPNPLKDCPLATSCILHCKKMNTVANETVKKGIRAYFGCHNSHDSLGKVKRILGKKTSTKTTTKTSTFHDPIIKQTLDSIIGEVLKTPYREIINPVKHKIWQNHSFHPV